MAEERVRIRLGPGKTMEAPAHLPPRGAPGSLPGAGPYGDPLPGSALTGALPAAALTGALAAAPLSYPSAAPSQQQVAPVPTRAAARWTGRPVIALVEAFACGADDLALTVMRVADATDQRVALIALDPQNRLGMRLGSPANSLASAWGENARGQVRAAGHHWVVPAPDREDGLNEERITALFAAVSGEVDATVVDLGCRWEPRIFRPVLQLATHIWVLCRSDKGMALEMRLEQADFSGWTDLGRLHPVVLGEGKPAGAVSWGAYTAFLPDASGGPAQSFIMRELGGSVR